VTEEVEVILEGIRAALRERFGAQVRGA